MTVSMPISCGLKAVTVDVRFTGRRRAKLRIWLALKLIRLAAWVSGMEIIASVGDEPAFDEGLARNESDCTREYILVGGGPAAQAVPTAASVDTRSPLFDPALYQWGPLVDVLLDGERLERVISYDVRRGFVRTYRDEGGGTVVRQGSVELRLKQPGQG